MLKKSYYLLLLFSYLSFSQTIIVDDTDNSAGSLANLLLDGSCVVPTSFSYSSGQAVALFDGNGSTFPLTNGIIIRTGIAKHTEGLYTDTNLSSQLNTNSDPDLQIISNNTGQTDPITDTAFLQFDFVPISSAFSFDFVFASNEYGQWQCGFSDVFAFLLTDSSGTTTNLAVVEGTSDPITVSTIRDNAYNGSCTSENASLFSTYNVENPASSTLNMRGHTTVLNASSTLTPGENYTIRLVIGDYKTSSFDSAVFIDTGSFTTEIDLGEDITMCTGNSIDLTTGLNEAEFDHFWTLDGNPVNPVVTGNTLTTTQFGTYGVIAIKNGTACQIPGTITITDLIIGSPNDLTICNDGSTSYTYNLNTNDEVALGIDPDNYDLIYYASQADLDNNIPITTNITDYSLTEAELPTTIFIKIFNNQTGQFCDAELPFQLTLSNTEEATDPVNITICESTTTTTIDLTTQDAEILGILNAADFTITYYESQADLNNQIPIPGSSIDIPSGPINQEVWAQLTSVSNTNCFDSTSFNIITTPIPIVATLPDILECSVYTLIDIPDIDGDAIPDGVYYDGPYDPNNPGSANQLNAGDLITDGTIIYILSGPDANGCYNESSFEIEFIDEYSPDLHYCVNFFVPIYPPGNFYTETNGTGELIDPTEEFTSADSPLTIHYYAETTDPVTGVTSVCRDEAFTINIYDLPPATIPPNAPIVTCNNYTLPIIPDLNTDGSPDIIPTIDPDDIYYTDSAGNTYAPGDNISTSGTYTIHNEEQHPFTNSDGVEEIFTCSRSNSFEVSIITVSIIQPQCDSYILPNLDAGEYYLEANGQGIIIPQGSEIVIDENEPNGLTLLNDPTFVVSDSNPVEIFIFAPDTENVPNCTNNMSFILQINPSPIVDEFSDIELCINTPYIIGETDVLTNPGTFYVDDQLEEFPISNTTYTIGQAITVDSTIYVYMQDPITGCETQSSFEVDIRDLPPLPTIILDKYECDPYTLLPLTEGNYYSESNGTGTMYQAGDEIGSTIDPGTMANEAIPVYVFNEWNDLPGCTSEKIFTVYIYGINLGVFEDKNECESYTLPPLSVGKYYRQVNGVDEILPADYTFNYTIDPSAYTTDNPVTNTHTFYVYMENGDPIRDPSQCKAEESFTVTISQTPTLPLFSNIEACGEYVLPATSTISTTYDVNYYTAPGGNAADLINPATPRTIPEGEVSPYTETIYVHATATGNTNCIDTSSFTLTIYERPNFVINDTAICVNPETGVVAQENYILIESGINPAQFTINWYLNGSLIHTGDEYYAEQAGEYTVETIMLAAENPPNCNYNSTMFTVLESSTAIATFNITEDFEDNAIITINVTNGQGIYQYQLDDGPFQDSNVFHDVISGDHSVTIIDIYGNCGEFELPVFVLKYPKFFTPNGDGINDTWNIVDLANQPDAKINIFDRFGKFIVQIAPAGNGWNGSYNNSQLPSTDYWFSVSYKGRNGEDKEFKAHFSLKR